MHLGRTEPTTCSMTSDPRQQELTIVQEEKDLSIIITNDLKPSKQRAETAKKATTTLRYIRQSFTSTIKESFSILYKAYVHPHMECCVQVWRPFLQKDIEVLDKMQRRATKLVRGLSNLPYKERLKQLDLFRLEAQRDRGDPQEESTSSKFTRCSESQVISRQRNSSK